VSVLALLVLAGLLLAGGFLAGFVWAARTGQFDDTTTPAVRVLMDGDDPLPPPRPASAAAMSQETRT
jgi:cbb3-type cytochrome oxidase maturation protein